MRRFAMVAALATLMVGVTPVGGQEPTCQEKLLAAPFDELILPDDAFFAFMRPDIRGGWMGSINALYGIDMLISCQDDGRLWLRRTFDSIGGSDVAFAAIGDSTVIKKYGEASYLLLFQRGDIVVQMDAQGTDVTPEALESLASIAAAIDETLPR